MSIPARFLDGSDDPPRAYTVAELILFLRELPPGLAVRSADGTGVELAIRDSTSKRHKPTLQFYPIDDAEDDSELDDAASPDPTLD